MRWASALAHTLAWALSAVPVCAAAQAPSNTHATPHDAHSTDSSGGVRVVVGAMANGVLTRESPAYASRTFTELQLIQPVLMARASWRTFAIDATMNGEGYTLKRGELNPGIFGEGYVDRRHPHTLVHEAMVSWRGPGFGMPTSKLNADFSLAAGRGFVPFGSDDPMMRPIEKYPVNHHHAQIIERMQMIVAARLTRDAKLVALEYARFNGDEPVSPFAGPNWSRFGDSWSARATLRLADGVELSGSRALVKSPEIQQGGAFDHAQHHAALRVDRPGNAGDSRYVLAEWARTDEITNHRVAFRYYSSLVEGAYGWHGIEGALRAELTDRAEGSRLLDPFREPLGHIDFQILGVTRWQVSTLALRAPRYTIPLAGTAMRVAPFIEVARAFPGPRNRPTVFEPSAFYGRPTLWSLSVGLRMQIGESHMNGMHAGTHDRMGAYGVMRSAAREREPQRAM